MDVARHKRRLAVTAAVNLVCLAVAAAAAVGALGYHMAWMKGPFVLALAAGFGSQAWLIAGLMREKPR